jgi:hypothetical protein
VFESNFCHERCLLVIRVCTSTPDGPDIRETKAILSYSQPRWACADEKAA